LIVVGGFVYFRGRQLVARHSAPAVLRTDRPSVLHLRPFKTDSKIMNQGFAALLTQTLITGLATDEEQIADALKPVGDLVAIGQPDEKLPTPGAARLHATDDEWRYAVIYRMRVAQLVVIRAGLGEGVLWELGTARELMEPERLLIWVFQMNERAYGSFRKDAERALGVALPSRPWKWPGGRNGSQRVHPILV
jgi:hypothetical protein